MRLWLGEGTGAAAAVADAAAGDVDGARSGGLSVLVAAASGDVTSGVDGTFAEINGNDLATHAAGGGGAV